MLLTVNVFQLYLAIVLSFNVIFSLVPSNNKRKLPANNQNLERDPLMQIMARLLFRKFFDFLLPDPSNDSTTLVLEILSEGL